MELSQISNVNFNSFNNTELSKTKNVENVEKSSNSIHLKSTMVDSDVEHQNSFSSNVMSSVNKIADLQQLQVSINKQMETATKIHTITKEAIDTPKNNQVLNDIQPQIQSMMNNFNSTSKINSTKMEVLDDEGISNSSASRTYFDGVVGAKPLSGEEIYKAVVEQQERLSAVSSAISKEIQNIAKDTKQSINLEHETKQNPELKHIDFEQESKNFDKQSLKTFEGSIPASQANAETTQSVKLLAS